MRVWVCECVHVHVSGVNKSLQTLLSPLSLLHQCDSRNSCPGGESTSKCSSLNELLTVSSYSSVITMGIPCLYGIDLVVNFTWFFSSHSIYGTIEYENQEVPYRRKCLDGPSVLPLGTEGVLVWWSAPGPTASQLAGAGLCFVSWFSVLCKAFALSLNWASSQLHIQTPPPSHWGAMWCAARFASLRVKVGVPPLPGVLSSMAEFPPTPAVDAPAPLCTLLPLPSFSVLYLSFSPHCSVASSLSICSWPPLPSPLLLFPLPLPISLLTPLSSSFPGLVGPLLLGVGTGWILDVEANVLKPEFPQNGEIPNFPMTNNSNSC